MLNSEVHAASAKRVQWDRKPSVTVDALDSWWCFLQTLCHQPCENGRPEVKIRVWHCVCVYVCRYISSNLTSNLLGPNKVQVHSVKCIPGHTLWPRDDRSFSITFRCVWDESLVIIIHAFALVIIICKSAKMSWIVPISKLMKTGALNWSFILACEYRSWYNFILSFNFNAVVAISNPTVTNCLVIARLRITSLHVLGSLLRRMIVLWRRFLFNIWEVCWCQCEAKT